MRSDDAADDVVRSADTAHPVAHRFVGGVLERAAAAGHLVHAGTHETHAEDVQRLPAHVLCTHVDLAGQAEPRAGGRGRHAVLACAGLGDDPCLAHAPGEQNLPERVVDLVCAGVREILALEPDLRAACMLGEPRRGAERGRTAYEVAQQIGQLRLERRIDACGEVGGLEFIERGHQGLGHVPTSEAAEASEDRIWRSRGHEGSVGAPTGRRCINAPIGPESA